MNNAIGRLDLKEASGVFIVSENQFEIISPGHAMQLQVFVARENGIFEEKKTN